MSLQPDSIETIVAAMAGRGLGETKTRRVVMVAYPDFEVLDVTGPLEVFDAAGRVAAAGGRGYSIELVARRAGPLRSSCGLRLLADRALGDVRGPIDTLVVAGGEGTRAAVGDTALVDWIRGAAARSRRVASVCSGAFLLAAAGLLDGRRATTHWAACEELRQNFPAVRVESDPVFVRDGKFATSAGVTAGMDLALALVEEDCGREVALEVARWLVLFLKRPGGQSQFSVQLAAQLAERDSIRAAQAWVVENPHADLSVEALAARAAMSPRNFARVFAREVGMTPARFVERTRVEAARRRLEESRDGIDTVAAGCGFGSGETMRRAFLRQVRVGPAAYRSRFQRPAENAGAATLRPPRRGAARKRRAS